MEQNNELLSPSLVSGIPESSLAGLRLDVVESELIPQTEAVVVEAARVALEDAGPLGFSFMDDGGAKVEVVEASVVSLSEGTGRGGVGRSHPDVKVSLVIDQAAHISGDGSVNVDLVLGAGGVDSVKELSVSLNGRWDLRSESAGLSFGEVLAIWESLVGAEGDVGVDLEGLNKVGGKGSSLVHLEVEELELNLVVQGLGEGSESGKSWSPCCGKRGSKGDGAIGTGWGRERGHRREQQGS